MPIEYGITRKINPNNFWDVYFGEIVMLWRDVDLRPGSKINFSTYSCHPAWSHTGLHKTASVVKKEYFKKTGKNYMNSRSRKLMRWTPQKLRSQVLKASAGQKE